MLGGVRITSRGPVPPMSSNPSTSGYLKEGTVMPAAGIVAAGGVVGQSMATRDVAETGLGGPLGES